MSRGPRPGQPSKVDYVAKAAAAWGEQVPEWIEVLADCCSSRSAVVVSRQIGYSASCVSHVLANTYKGDLAAVEAAVRGALMGETVICPILGEIGRNHCLDEQKKPRVATSSIRSKVWRACRSGCPHSRLKSAGGG